MFYIKIEKDNRSDYIFGRVGMWMDNFIHGGQSTREARRLMKAQRDWKKLNPNIVNH